MNDGEEAGEDENIIEGLGRDNENGEGEPAGQDGSNLQNPYVIEPDAEEDQGEEESVEDAKAEESVLLVFMVMASWLVGFYLGASASALWMRRTSMTVWTGSQFVCCC